MYDVLIIGAGVIGASIFRELTKYNLKVAVVEKENDVAMGTTKANSAIIHAGYDPKCGTLMAKYNVRGNDMFEKICSELSVPFKRIGSLVLAFNNEDLKVIKDLFINGNNNGVKGLEILNKEEVLSLEPNISKEVIGALYAPTAGIIGPFEYTIALMENGYKNGGDIILESEVVSIDKLEEIFIIKIKDGKEIKAKYIINAAGIYADKIHNMICKEKFKIIPRKGEYYVMDKSQGNIVNHTIFPCPSKVGKGILVTPTVHGNILVGPNAVDLEDKESLNTTSEGLKYIRKSVAHITEKIDFKESIRTFSGLRATSTINDFIIGEDSEVKGFIDVAGIKSPGLSSAPAIAEDIIKLLRNSGLNLMKNDNFIEVRTQVRMSELSPLEKEELIKNQPLYGRMICRCEGITEGEIVDIIKNSFGKITLDGVKRRCRPGMGRCQGGFCGPRVQEIIARELNIKMEDVLLEKNDSIILYGKSK
ncbi:NAD(P)/FAD-dependent oxidoreductase [Clostridium disporicum]|uniref:NAD(P)/FAD-dependent oxidoreductase n=1 Tax=Clostridium disporicum TaxID=84024 RepID=UPI0028FEBA4E|nr:NAD(P)/FAD-dependent oxidoreductase [Clostridium celatum]MDU4325535.1 NAD(P)/FAD-dependent oxidoreductase [Clostridium celatum]